MAENSPLQVFIASPSDLQTERQVIRDVIDEINRTNVDGTLPLVHAVGWESIPGTARRPQEAINDTLRRCDYLVVMLKESWGSATGSSWGYTSGTEEELFAGLLLLGDRNALLRDVWIVFAAARSPLPQVTALRQQLEANHALFYETTSDLSDLREKALRRMLAWRGDTAPRISREVDLMPSSGRPVLTAARLRREGETLADMGEQDQAEARLKKASAIGDPEAMLAYAKFLFRAGRLPEAEAWNRQVTKLADQPDGTLLSATTARAYANLGLIERKRGHLADAINAQRHALGLLDGADPRFAHARAEILDAVGLTLQDDGQFEDAMTAFRDSLKIRESLGDEPAIAQSHVNISRRLMNSNDLDGADAHLSRTFDIVGATAPTPLHANAWALRAQLHEKRGQLPRALTAATRCLELNRAFANSAGQAVALSVIARIGISRTDWEEAKAAISECLDINTQASNALGQANCHHLLAEVAAGEADWPEAVAQLEQELALRKSQSNPAQLAFVYAAYCRALAGVSRLDDARRALDDARDLAGSSEPSTDLAAVIAECDRIIGQAAT